MRMLLLTSMPHTFPLFSFLSFPTRHPRIIFAYPVANIPPPPKMGRLRGAEAPLPIFPPLLQRRGGLGGEVDK